MPIQTLNASACRAAVGGSARFCFIDCDFAIKFGAESETSGGAAHVGQGFTHLFGRPDDFAGLDDAQILVHAKSCLPPGEHAVLSGTVHRTHGHFCN